MSGKYEDNSFFIGDFDDALEDAVVLPLAREIKDQSEKANGRVDLWINSVGGYAHLCYHLVELVELAKRNDVVVRTIVPDIAFSAGSMLAITGTPGERYIGRGAEHLIHYGQQMSFESTPTQIERFTKYKERAFKANIKHYQRYADVPDLESEMLDDGFFVPAKQAISWGMADKYLDKMPLI